MVDWEGTLEGYVKKVIHKDCWKYKKYGYEYEDLLNEAWIVYNNCKEKYIVNTKAHFVSLYKKSLYTHFTEILIFSDVRNRRNRRRKKHIDLTDNLENVSKNDDYNLDLIFDDAPSLIKNVYEILTSKEKMIQLNINPEKKITNQILHKALGIREHSINLIDMLKAYISGGN